MKIVVACGAGASSAFVAVKLRHAAAARGMQVTVAARSLSQLDSLADVDILLIGAHLMATVPALRGRAAETGTAVAVLPPLSPGTLTGEQALDLAVRARSGRHQSERQLPHTTKENHNHG